MTVRSGFFNSLNGDRRYNSEEMSAIFDGIINDGVFANVGSAFAVTADTGNSVTVGVGRAWFDSKWIYNDAILPVFLENSELVLDRIDAIVIEIDNSESIRKGDIKIVKGTPASNPVNPTMADTSSKHQHPLSFIYRKAGSTGIKQADITNVVGTSQCPYVTGILKTVSIDNLVAQWEDQWRQWFIETTNDANSDMGQQKDQMEEWMLQARTEFEVWLNSLDVSLTGDVAANLANEILELQEKFDTLAKELVIYGDIKDANGNPIEDSYGTAIEGRTVFGIFSDGGGSGAGGSSSTAIDFYVEVDTDWEGSTAPYTKTVVVSGITKADEPFVDIVHSDDFSKVEAEAESYGYIYKIETDTDSVKFFATDKPTSSMFIKMKAFR